MLGEIWTKDALLDVEEILDYLVRHWDQKIIRRFYSDLNNSLSIIKERPNTFQYFDKGRKIRTCLPNQHFRLYFKVLGDNLIILRIYPNRKDSEKLLFR